MQNRGLLNPELLKKLVSNEEIETVIVAFTDHYGRLMGKRYDAEFFLESALKEGTHGCDYLLTTDMEMEPVPGYDYANWELGYGDFHMVPDSQLCVWRIGLRKPLWFCAISKEIRRLI